MQRHAFLRREALVITSKLMPSAVPKVRGNLGALILEGGRPSEALVEFELAMAAEKTGGLMFNRAKALSILGRIEEADAAFAETAAFANGSDFTVRRPRSGLYISSMPLRDGLDLFTLSVVCQGCCSHGARER